MGTRTRTFRDAVLILSTITLNAAIEAAEPILSSHPTGVTCMHINDHKFIQRYFPKGEKAVIRLETFMKERRKSYNYKKKATRAS